MTLRADLALLFVLGSGVLPGPGSPAPHIAPGRTFPRSARDCTLRSRAHSVQQ